MNKDNWLIFGGEKSKRQNWTAQPGCNSVGTQNTQLHFMKYEAKLVLYLKKGNTCKLIASPIPCVQKFNYIFAACLSKSVGFLQNYHGILSSIPEDSVSIHK